MLQKAKGGLCFQDMQWLASFQTLMEHSEGRLYWACQSTKVLWKAQKKAPPSWKGVELFKFQD